MPVEPRLPKDPQRLLAEPPPHRVDVGPGFDQQRADGVAQVVAVFSPAQKLAG
jgi:hypothetical protein